MKKLAILLAVMIGLAPQVFAKANGKAEAAPSGKLNGKKIETALERKATTQDIQCEFWTKRLANAKPARMDYFAKIAIPRDPFGIFGAREVVCTVNDIPVRYESDGRTLNAGLVLEMPWERWEEILDKCIPTKDNYSLGVRLVYETFTIHDDKGLWIKQSSNTENRKEYMDTTYWRDYDCNVEGKHLEFMSVD